MQMDSLIDIKVNRQMNSLIDKKLDRWTVVKK